MQLNFFIDANIFVSFFNSQDSNYDKAGLIFEDFNKVQVKLFTLDLIIYESLTVLSQRGSKNLALEFKKFINKKKSLQVFKKSDKLEKLAFRLFKKVKSKNFSFVDAFILAVLKQNSWLTLASFDKKLVKEAKKLNLKAY